MVAMLTMVPFQSKNNTVVRRSLRQTSLGDRVEWVAKRYRLPEDSAQLNSDVTAAKKFPLPTGLSIEDPNK